MGGEGGGGAPGQDEGLKVDVDKTYNTIIAKKEAKLSRDALLERRAIMLTRHFMRTREEEEKKQLAKMAEVSSESYERSMKKIREQLAAESQATALVAEERAVIAESMAEQARRKKEKEMQELAEKREREKWKEARNLYDQMQSEERKKVLQDKDKEKFNKAKEKMEKNAAAYKEWQETSEAERAAQASKVTAELGKATERRKKLMQESWQAKTTMISELDRKTQEADNRRKKHQDEVERKVKEHMAKVDQQVDDCAKRRAKHQEELKAKVLAKARIFRERNDGTYQPNNDELAEKESQEDDDAEPRIASKAKRKASKHSGGESAQQHGNRTAAQQAAKTQDASRQEKDTEGEGDKAKKQEDKTGGNAPVSHHSQELITANQRAHRDYVRKLADLRQAEYHMMSKKHFKSMAESALSKQDNETEICSVRMRSIHNMYFGQKEKTAKDSSSKTDASPQSKEKSGASTARTPRKERILPCGLCEREFPPENLVGSAMKKTILKLTHKYHDKSRRSAEGRKKVKTEEATLLPGELSQSRLEVNGKDTQSKGGDSRATPGARLYDCEVGLCGSCYQFVRTVTA
eukprot:TRINITY_DN31328_c0_g1_i1.p1 TRINITY_DN31328_c0_g1~~TRINITY_DN31328_c0_g1_i1.p1  ORF type:complete len:579 (+),score=151.73 TRINITY_DN31328_c0_g1_i1:84-1820(+)